MSEALHPEEEVTTFLLVRHGHTKATEQGVLYANPQTELTALGIEQAHILAKWVASQGINSLLSSTAIRAVSTAEIIGSSINIVPTQIIGLDEWKVGDWEGRTYLDIKKSEPAVYRDWSINPIINKPPNGESIADLCERAWSRFDQLISVYPSKKIVLVTHAGIIRTILLKALGMPVNNFWRLSIPAGSVSRIDFSASFATVQFMSLPPK
jgi:alpha-ribazole phosphatase